MDDARWRTIQHLAPQAPPALRPQLILKKNSFNLKLSGNEVYYATWPLCWEEFHESRRCSKDTYPESYITEYILI